MTDQNAKTIQRGLYKHNKTGNLYEVVGVALHTETDEQFVIYRAASYDSDYELFARPYEMFIGTVEINAEQVPRFKYVAKAK
jgi:hypothetical protein